MEYELLSDPYSAGLLLKEYVFAIGYAKKKVSDKRDYYTFEMTYDVDKIRALNKKYKVNF